MGIISMRIECACGDEHTVNVSANESKQIVGKVSATVSHSRIYFLSVTELISLRSWVNDALSNSTTSGEMYPLMIMTSERSDGISVKVTNASAWSASMGTVSP